MDEKTSSRAQIVQPGESKGWGAGKKGLPEKTKWGDYRGEWLYHLWVAFVVRWVGG